MKQASLFLAASLLTSPSLVQTPLPQQAESDWKAVQRAWEVEPLRFENYRNAGLRFWAKHPKDTRRYEWLQTTLMHPPENQTLQSRARWEAQYKKMWQEVETDSRLGDEQRFVIASTKLQRDLIDAEHALSRSMRVDLVSLRNDLLALAARFPRQTVHPKFDEYLIYSPGRSGLTSFNALAEFIQPLSESPNLALRDYAQRKLALLAYQEKPVDLRLTATDGSEIDLSKLRGKVVFIDFWGPW